MTFLRRATQLFVIVALTLIAVLNQYESAKVKYYSDPVIADSPLYAFIDKKIGKREDRSRLTTAVRGNIWSLKIGRFGFSDPLAVLTSAARARIIYLPFLLTGLIPIILTILLGRVFCGWICPMNLILEINNIIRSRLEKIGLAFFDFRLPGQTKYLLLLLGVVIALLSGVDLFSQIYPPRIISSEIYSLFSSSLTEMGLIFLGVIIFVELFFSRRMWCRYFCPGGALYSLMSGLRIYRIRKSASKCASCMKCDEVCPLAINPSAGRFSMDCDGCASCVDACEFGALSVGLGRGEIK